MKVIWGSYVAAAVMVMAAGPSNCSAADDPAFSGPQVGERLMPFQANGVLRDLENKSFDLVSEAADKPVVIVFLHKLTRPSAALTRAVMSYASGYSDQGAVCGVVFLSDDSTATAEQIRRAAHALPEVPIGISADGGEGPGSYGLNRNMTLTVLVGKEGRVTANFPLVQPSLQVDARKIGRAIALAVGRDETPTLAQMGVADQYGQRQKMQRNNRTARTQQPEQDSNLRPLLAALIRKDATEEQVDQAAAKIVEYAAENATARQQIAEIASRIIKAGRLQNYGTIPAQDYLTKWAKEFAPEEN